VLNSPDERIFRFHEPQVRLRNGSDGQRPFVVLYHGSLVRRNGLDLAVDALEIVRREIPAARLMICGKRTSFLDEVMESVARRGLTPVVEYLGGKDLEGIVSAIQQCDVGVIPNHRNLFTELNTPTRILECLALGKPVIAPRARGIQDYFDEEDLIYFELGDSRDLAEKIKYAYSNSQDVEQTVKRGQRIYRNHTWTSEKANLLNAFVELA
jgi:glycosyltransferase involved in cell wall biosynthesis